MKAMDSTAVSRFGVVERFAPGQYQHVDGALKRLRMCKIERLRIPLRLDEYSTIDGEAWYDWLLPMLAQDIGVLPCLQYAAPQLGERASLSAGVDRLAGRHPALFDAVELWGGSTDLLDRHWPAHPPKSCEEIRQAATRAHQHGLKVVLGIPWPVDPDWLGTIGETGVLEAIDAIGLHTFPELTDGWPGWHSVIRHVRETAARFNASPAIWITETGQSVTACDLPAQLQAFQAALAARAERVFWHSLQDPSRPGPEEHARHFGLFTQAGQPTPLGRLMIEGGPTKAAQIAHLSRPPVLTSRPVLITGGAGFIGSNLAERLAQGGQDVLIYDSLARPGVEENALALQRAYPERISVMIADIRDEAAISDAVSSAAAVFHFAAQVAVTTSMADPREDFAVNAGGTLVLLEALRRQVAAPPLIFASTNKVYGNLADIALQAGENRYLPADRNLRQWGIGEDRPLDFHTPYGCSKGSADQYVLDYCHSFGIPTTVLRMSCIYGRRQRGTEDQGWVAHFLLRGLAGDPVTIYGDGRQVRDVLWIDDALDAYMAAWKHIGEIRGKAFNLGGGPVNAVSLLQVIAEIETILGHKLETRFAEWRPGDQRYFVADRRRVEQALRLSPPLHWRRGLVRLAEWFTDRRHTQSTVPATGAIEVHA